MKTNRRILRFVPLRAVALALLSLATIVPQRAILAQGGLGPTGAPAPTMKTLDQVEPLIPVDATHTPGDATSVFMLTQPGSYYLTANLVGTQGKNGIVIAASNVRLDLNGFEVAGATGSLNGILIGSNPVRSNVRIANGTIRNWDTDGVSGIVSPCDYFSRLQVLNNKGPVFALVRRARLRTATWWPTGRMEFLAPSRWIRAGCSTATFGAISASES